MTNAVRQENSLELFTSATTLDEAYDGLGLKDFEVEFLRQRKRSTPAASRASASGSRLEI